MRRIFCFFCLLASACDDPRTITIDVTTGHEEDTFSLDPAVTRIDVIAQGSDGKSVASATSAPGGTFSMGELAIDQFVRLEVVGLDASGDKQVGGHSLGVVVGGVDGEVLPVFAQRIDRWSRPPGELTHGHDVGVGAVIGERYLMLSGGNGLDGASEDVAFYDMLSLGGAVGGALSLSPTVIVVSADARAALFISDDRAAWVDFQEGDGFEVDPPADIGSWSHLAGGRTIVSEAQSFVVGATRAGEPSDRVLVVAADRTLSGATLTAPRAGAAAAYVAEVGLVIAGGDATASGVEVLRDGESQATPLSFPPDPTTGAGAAIGQPEELILVAGDDGSGASAAVRSIDLRCVADCAAVALSPDLGLLLTRGQAFATSGGTLLVTGNDPDGLLRSFSVYPTTAEVFELPLREPRRGAAVFPAPNGTLAVMGGVREDGSPALTVELLLPR